MFSLATHFLGQPINRSQLNTIDQPLTCQDARTASIAATAFAATDLCQIGKSTTFAAFRTLDPKSSSITNKHMKSEPKASVSGALLHAPQISLLENDTTLQPIQPWTIGIRPRHQQPPHRHDYASSNPGTHADVSSNGGGYSTSISARALFLRIFDSKCFLSTTLLQSAHHSWVMRQFDLANSIPSRTWYHHTNREYMVSCISQPNLHQKIKPSWSQVRHHLPGATIFFAEAPCPSRFPCARLPSPDKQRRQIFTLLPDDSKIPTCLSIPISIL